ncbi:MAG: hypothetical protein E7175_01550 [Erysipelotrichaceae bacterium]|nr:hypothetical protein [Erysipelotrichaceae bacterium]
MKHKIIYLNEERFVDTPISVLDIVGDNKDIFACYVNGRLRELTYVFDYDATIEPLTAKDRDGKFIYESSLRFIVAMALNTVYPSAKYNFSYSISRSIYLTITSKEIPVDDGLINKLNRAMEKIVEADYPLNRYKMPKDEILNIYQEHGFYHKIELFRYRPEPTAHIYECNGYYNYMYSRMVPSTGYIKKWKLRKYDEGILIQYPRPDTNGEIPEFKDAPAFKDALAKAKQQALITGVDSVIGINKKLEREGEIELINLAEAVHSRQLAELGDVISKNIKNIRLICIAGPSSSGKTTFSNRLRIELLSRGIKPLMISLDNYYKPMDEIVKDEKGDYDFESIYSLDVELFNQNMSDLIAGKTVNLPYRDFKTKNRTYMKGVYIDKNQPIIIEGIHALNDMMTAQIPEKNKYKIFISPTVQISLDNDNPLILTDLRLLRRIVRDYKFRNEPASGTMAGWDNVRKGEFKWIYHTQENANYIFNSFLAYELCALKEHAEPLLKAIKKESEYFPIAERLLRLLKFFDPISSKWIPCNSLIREFIGGSCYQEEED